MRTVLALLVTLFVIPTTAAGQGMVTGSVDEAQSGDPLPGVQVVIPDLQVGTTTDAEGSYTLQDVPTGEYTLEARFVGYRTGEKTITVSEGEETTVNFSLRQTSVDLS